MAIIIFTDQPEHEKLSLLKTLLTLGLRLDIRLTGRIGEYHVRIEVLPVRKANVPLIISQGNK